MKNAAQCPTQHGYKLCGACSDDDDDDDDDSDVAPQFQIASPPSPLASAVSQHRLPML